MRKLYAFLLFSLSVPLLADVPGGIVKIPLAVNSVSAPQVYFQDHRVLVMPSTNGWTAVVGIDLTTRPGTYTIKIQHGENIQTQDFIVKPKKYPTERLTIKNHRKVEPLAQDLPLIRAQQAEIIDTYNQWRSADVTALQLRVPVAGRFSSPFGQQRIMNNIPKQPHSGLDIAAPKGTPVHAARAGIVTNTGNYFYNGNIIFIDHGQGFITSYCHLDSIAVHKGQTVKEGEVIGTVGNTGRATGPHLHWSVSLNGVRIDPTLLIHEPNN